MFLGIIRPEDFNFHMLDVTRPPVDPKLTPPTQNSESFNLESWPNPYVSRGNTTYRFQFLHARRHQTTL